MVGARGFRIVARLAALAAVLACPGARAGGPAPGDVEKMRAFAHGLLARELYDESIDAYRLIAEQTPGTARSHYDLAAALAFVRRYPEAIEPAERALALAPDDALYLELAAICYQESQQYDKAFAATRRGAEQGDIKAMYSLAGMYEHGRGVEASDADALAWLERAARAGHLGAVSAMARVHRDGLYGVPRDPEQARRWDEMLARELAR